MKSDDVKALVDTLTERLNNTIKLFDELKAEYKQFRDDHQDLRREFEKENAVLKQQVEDLKKNKDLWSSRAFTIFMCLLSAVIGFVTGYFKKPS